MRVLNRYYTCSTGELTVYWTLTSVRAGLARSSAPRNQWKRIVGLAGGARLGEASERGERPGEWEAAKEAEAAL